MLEDFYNVPHPSWVRGLKCDASQAALPAVKAAPFVGAWIEIIVAGHAVISSLSPHPSWVRGLKYTYRVP